MRETWSNVDWLCSEAAVAKEIYVESLNPAEFRGLWHKAVDQASSEFSQRIEEAFANGLAESIANSAGVVELLRSLTAPPLSQDQFKLRCDHYSKEAEKHGKPVTADKAAKIAAAIEAWIDPNIREGISRNELAAIATGPIYLLANQKFSTDRRKHLSAQQEEGVRRVLLNNGYAQVEAAKIDQPWELGAGNFMHKTKFSIGEGASEVDIAAGIRSDRLLALECKVSNDATNSIKRKNDVLKKKAAWSTNYGRVLTTGAVLQGVFTSNHIRELVAAGVLVFFSHRLDELESFLVHADG